jgi:YVTN family beta-propeller protein
MRKDWYLLLVVGAAIAGLALPASAMPMAFHLVTRIQLPGTGGHGDMVEFDPQNNRVYLSLHGSGVAVIDPSTNTVVATVEPIKGPNGIAFDTDYVYVAAGDANQLVVISKRDWSIVGRVKTEGTTPDGIWFDRTHGTVVVASDDNNWLEIYSAGATPRLMKTIALQPAKAKSGPDVGVLVRSRDILYMPDDSMVEAVHLGTGYIGPVVDTHVKLTKTGGTKNMIFDARSNRLWVGTTDNEVLVLDATTLRILDRLPARGGIDEVAFDPALRLVYTFEGPAKGFDVYNASTMMHEAFVDTGSGNTHTGTVDLKTHDVYAYEGNANVVGVYLPPATAARR